MNLAIVVVYMLRDENAPLLDLHLRYIERHTTVPWTIHAGTTRLDAKYRRVLERHPNVRVRDLPPTDGKMVEEHSHDLQLLTDMAVAEGATHVATLHPDSFPIRDGWAEHLDAQLSAERPLAAVLEAECGDTMARPCPAGLLVRADFWREHRPRFMPAKGEVESDDFRGFMERHRQVPAHSGLGIGWALDRAGMTWLPLRRSNARNDHHTMAGIYGDTFFHLGAAARGKWFWLDHPRRIRSPIERGLNRLVGIAERELGSFAVDAARRAMPLRALQLADRRGAAMRISARIARRLFLDPEAYIASLR